MNAIFQLPCESLIFFRTSSHWQPEGFLQSRVAMDLILKDPRDRLQRHLISEEAGLAPTIEDMGSSRDVLGRRGLMIQSSIRR